MFVVSGIFSCQSQSLFLRYLERRNLIMLSNCMKRAFHSTSVRLAAGGYEDVKFSKIIVGAGSAGCVLANRLTEDSNSNVLLLEAGPKDTILGTKWLQWKIHMPAALTYNLCDDKYNWFYHTVPQKNVNNRVMYWPRGRVWGGSSSLNAMAYVRGHAEDYNRWEREGASGWSYEDVLPYFKKAQTHSDGGDDYRGHDGPLHVTRFPGEGELDQAWLKAGQQAGYPLTADMNGYQQEGVGHMDSTCHKGERWSAASAYLRPVLQRKNLTTMNDVLVTRILFEGKKAVGIELIQKGITKRFRADEIILSGGAINSPQLLMLSGVGDSDHLGEVGVDTIHHLPGVGQNLQDHLEVYIAQGCKKPVSLLKDQKGLRMIKVGIQWFLNRTGSASSSHLETGGFIRSSADVPHPDIQFHFLPSQVIDHGRVAPKVEAFQVHVGSMRATSRGTLKLESNDPRKHPLLDPNYLGSEQDKYEMRQCVKLTREIFAQAAFDEYRGDEIAPGSDVQTDEEIDEFIRRKGDSAYHPSCTCKMGDTGDNMAVVDSQCRVIGLENLRVVDASIMPSIVSGNLNAPTIMLAEKAADIIRGTKLPPATGIKVYETDMSKQR